MFVALWVGADNCWRSSRGGEHRLIFEERACAIDCPRRDQLAISLAELAMAVRGAGRRVGETLCSPRSSAAARRRQ
eukprot:1087242-Rhodomonas_salina.1